MNSTWGFRGTLNVPVKICQLAIREKVCSELKLFTYLKGSCDGVRKISSANIRSISEELKIDSKTIRANLKKLVKRNWIGLNHHSGNYFIRGFNCVLAQYGLKCKSNALLHFEDLHFIKEFCFSSYIQYLINARKYYQRKNGIRVSKGSALQNSKNPKVISSLLNYTPTFDTNQIATTSLMVIFCRSKSNISNLKSKAHETGYLSIKKRFRMIDDTSRFNHQKKYMISDWNGNKIKRVFPSIANRLKKLSGKLIIQECDRLETSIKIRRRKKRETILKGSKGSNNYKSS